MDLVVDLKVLPITIGILRALKVTLLSLKRGNFIHLIQLKGRVKQVIPGFKPLITAEVGLLVQSLHSWRGL